MIIKKRIIWFVISGTLVFVSLVSLIINKLPFGIDFTGGNIAEVKFNQSTSSDEVRSLLTDHQIDASVQTIGENTYSIKFNHQVSQPEEGSATKESSSLPQEKVIADAIGDKGTVQRFDTVGPSVSLTLQKNALLAILYSIIGIIIYLAWAFRSAGKIASSWAFGTISIIALLHDTIIVAGAFSILGVIFPEIITVDTYFITAILTILGYSVNDTIVVFDRMREVAHRHPEYNVSEIAQKSVYSTLGRSLNTSLTVFLVLIAMLVLGGGTLFSFLFALTIGVFFGTYSSICIAAPLLVTWHNYLARRHA